jgi:hypothetical protein
MVDKTFHQRYGTQQLHKTQTDLDIEKVLGRMGELMDKYSIPHVINNGNPRETEFGRRWIVPQAEYTYNNYARILVLLEERRRKSNAQP